MLKKAIKKAKENKKGFTLAELLIVVAIIAVLVAISIPIFTTQLEKSRDAVSVSNIRAAYAQASAEYLTSDENGTGNSIEEKVELKGTQKGWSNMEDELSFKHDGMTDEIGGTAGTYTAMFVFDANGGCNLKTLTKATE